MMKASSRIWAIALLGIGLSWNTVTTAQPRPNILFILVDDLGWADLGYAGSTSYETPHVDQLSTQGIVFTNFYAGGPVCSPTRASILTGKSTARTGITTYLITPDQDAEYVTHKLPLSEFTIAEAFKKNGYTTGIFGKWHLGYGREHWAGNQGFDTAIGGTTSKNAWRMIYPDRQPPIDQLEVRYFSPHYLTHMEDGPKEEYLTDRLTDETIEFIKANKDRPFFAFLSFHTVHTPLEAKKNAIAKYEGRYRAAGILGNDEAEFGSRKYQNLPAYAAMVQHMDENVGRLLDHLDALGLTERTIVVFTSDNGGKHSITSNAPLRGAKHNLYEGGIRVPLIVRYPGKVQAAASTDIPLISDDFYPTLLQMTGLPLEENQHLDGVSFSPLLLEGKAKKLRKRPLFWHYPHNRFEAAVRWKNYKLLYRYKTGSSELYDLSPDPGERRDISAVRPKVVRKMKRKLSKWLKETDAQFPKDNIILP